MPMQIVTIPCLQDNYAFLLFDDVRKIAAVVDAPDSRPILAALAERNWAAYPIFLTHHHGDHVQGVQDILDKHPQARAVCALQDSLRIPVAERRALAGEVLDFSGHDVRVIDVSGHTMGHVAYYVPDAKAVFTGDSLMALGCGRVFEGTPEIMLASLKTIAALPPDTLVCSGHEYTRTNARFALTIDPDNPALQARARAVEAAAEQGTPTVPSLLSDELATNPFLRADDPAIRANLGMQSAPEVEVFAEIRRRKDNF